MSSSFSRVTAAWAPPRCASEFVSLKHAGLEVVLSTCGASLLSLKAPDRSGVASEVTVHFPEQHPGLLENDCYFGVTAGRVANRIAGGKFSVDGEEYTLATNNGPNCLHGGVKGWSHLEWAVQDAPGLTDSEVGVRFSYESKDGEEGFPGTVKATVDYVLTASKQLRIEFGAETDKATPINLCNHTYWNLCGDRKGDVKGHLLTLATPFYLPVDDTQIPTGEVKPVKDTVYDFLEETAIGARVESAGGAGGKMGYDHCFVRSDVSESKTGDALTEIARVREPESGRTMVVSTTQPGVQLYTGNFLSTEDGGLYGQYSGFCLETQHHPDAINKPHFPSTLLRPGETYKQVTVHEFGVMEE